MGRLLSQGFAFLVPDIERPRMDKLQVAKFDGQKDFLVRKVQIQAYLEAINLFRAADGSSEETSDAFRTMEAKAKAVILNSVETSVVRAIMSLRTSKEMWARLMTLYDSKSKISIGFLLEAFLTYRITEGMAMVDHIARVESMVTRLSDLGRTIEEPDVINKLLQLPRQYRHLISP